MSSIANERLRQFLKEGQAWEKKVTNIPGIFLLKLPPFKGNAPSIAIELNPVNASSGSATKKRGVIIKSSSELEQISRLLSNPKVAELAKSMDKVNPATNKESVTRYDVFEI
jgi:hypothetical protein